MLPGEGACTCLAGRLLQQHSFVFSKSSNAGQARSAVQWASAVIGAFIPSGLCLCRSAMMAFPMWASTQALQPCCWPQETKVAMWAFGTWTTCLSPQTVPAPCAHDFKVDDVVNETIVCHTVAYMLNRMTVVPSGYLHGWAADCLNASSRHKDCLPQEKCI